MDELLLRRDEATLNRLRLAEEFLDPRASAVNAPLRLAARASLLTPCCQMTNMCGATGQISF